jgi:hypothetical protein
VTWRTVSLVPGSCQLRSNRCETCSKGDGRGGGRLASDGGRKEMTELGFVAEHAQISVDLPQLVDVFSSSSVEVADDAEATGALNDNGSGTSELTLLKSVGLDDSGEADDRVDGASLLGWRSRLPDVRRGITLSTLRSTDVVTRSSLFGLGTKSLLPLICSLCVT